MVSPLVGGGRWEGGEGNTWKGNLLLDLYFKLIGFLGMESEWCWGGGGALPGNTLHWGTHSHGC